jgi:type IV secretion system protein VirB10
MILKSRRITMADDDYIPEDNDDDLKSTPDLNRNRPGMDNGLEGLDTDEIEIENGSSKLASTPAKNILIFAILGIGAVLFLYNMVFKEDEATKEKKETEKIVESQPVEAAIKPTKSDDKLPVDVGIVETPSLPKVEGLQPPPPPKLEEPTVELPAESYGGFEPPVTPPVTTPVPVTPTAPVVEIPTPTAQPLTTPPPAAVPPPNPNGGVPPAVVIVGPSPEELAARAAARRKSGMMVVNGGGAPSANKAGGTDDSSVTIGKTATTQVTATKVGNLDVMIVQGKMLDAVLETAINTDLPGLLRAVISRDIYAESGKNILIPRGSRLVGEYSNSISKGQQRVVVTWNRVIRPDGIDVAISSPGTDQLGHSGMTGIVDNKYMEILGRTLLMSIITVGGTMMADALNPAAATTNSTSTSADGATTSSQTGTPTDFAVIDAAKSLSDVATKIAEDSFNDKPTIIVQQGTLIKVFVNKDLIFPSSVANSINIVN